MTNEMIISESQSLYSDIDYCITELLKARTEHNSENEGKALFKMESLMVSTLQHLACIIEQPSLPSNIDEAAEKEIERFCSDMLNVDIIWARMPLTKRFGLQMAKFGAEWMAGQGETIDGEVVKDINNNLAITAKGFSGKEAVFGDKVIVQIRKKH